MLHSTKLKITTVCSLLVTFDCYTSVYPLILSIFLCNFVLGEILIQNIQLHLFLTHLRVLKLKPLAFHIIANMVLTAVCVLLYPQCNASQSTEESNFKVKLSEHLVDICGSFFSDLKSQTGLPFEQDKKNINVKLPRCICLASFFSLVSVHVVLV